MLYQVVLSRIGRKGSSRRRGSQSTSAAPSEATTCEEPDTIQWKRGNMLGKGAFGTVRQIIKQVIGYNPRRTLNVHNIMDVQLRK